MKRAVLVAVCLMLFQFAFSQNVSLADVKAMIDMKLSKLENQLQKKGFKKNGFSSEDATFFKLSQGEMGPIIRTIQIKSTAENREIEFTTSSQPEWKGIEKEIFSEGFIQSTIKTSTSTLFQKQNLVLNAFQMLVDSSLQYSISINKKQLPKINTIVFAEDLLQIDSHEYLAEVFGRQNVTKEIFSISPTQQKKCTIIFPNTLRQAIFLWSDEENRREISFIIFGEQLNGKNHKDLNVVQLSFWRSNQGVYCGMSLGEIQQLNKAPLRFYNWHTESAGFMAPQNEGVIDFDLLKPVFNCMNCNFLYIDNRSEIIQSPYSLSENQKVYVAGFVVAPEKEDLPGVSKK